MDKRGMKKVRRSIEQRRKERGLPTKHGTKKHIYPAFPEEEEKHGYFPSFSDSDPGTGRASRLLSPTLVLKAFISAILFLGVALLGQTEAAMLQTPKEWTSEALTEEFPFARVHLWYQETFGSPLALTPTEPDTAEGVRAALPVSGDITESFQANGTGIMIAPGGTTEVHALDEGVVVFAGNDRQTDQTVVVQHADGSTSTYGYLNDINVHLYQFVNGSQTIGQFTPDAENQTVYFSIEKDDSFIDPVQVIEVDDTP